MIYRLRSTTLLASTTAFLLLFLLCSGCKNTDDTPNAGTDLTSMQGSWKITAVKVDPAYLGSISDLIGALKLAGETCLNDLVVTFSASGRVTTNQATLPACTNAALTQRLLTTLFGTTSTYTESGTQLTIINNARTITATRAFTPTTATLVTTQDVNPVGDPIRTTYTITLTKQ